MSRIFLSRNSNIKCNSSRYSQILNIKSIYQRTSRKSLDNFKFEQKYKFKGHNSSKLYNYEFWLTLCKIVRSSVILLLPLFEFRSGRMIFGWVMTHELVFLFKFEVVRTFLWRPLIYWLDIWYWSKKQVRTT
jgi:hypothetical protein